MEAAKAHAKHSISWVVAPIGICVGVGLYFPGLSTTLAGIAGAVVCYLASRREQWKQSAQTTASAIIVALTIGAIGGIHGGSAVVEANRITSAEQSKVDDEAERKKIFAMAMQYKASIEEGTKELHRAQMTDASNYEFLRRRLESNKKSHVAHRAFTAQFYRISEEQLSRIINEGIAEDWEY